MKNIKLFSATLILLQILAGATFASVEMSPDTHEDDTALMEQIRSEQKEYYRQLQDYMPAYGFTPRAGAGSCKYISHIFTPPPDKTVVLTFDDGPDSSLTPVLLGILKKYGIKATFFMQGNRASANKALVQRVKAEGHIIGNHSYSHPNFHTLSPGQQVSEVTTTDSILKNQMTGLKIFRYPFGNSTCGMNAYAHKIGYKILGWHIDSCDWAFAKNGYVTEKQAELCAVRASHQADFVGHVISSVRESNGGIILMHEIHNRTVYSVEEIIVRLKREGYSFVNMDDPQMVRYFK